MVSRTTFCTSTLPFDVTSPATNTMPVVVIDSTATRESGSCLRKSSRIASDIWSHTLSGCPPVTLSEVKSHLFTICKLTPTSLLELFFQFDEQDVIAPYHDLAIVCKHVGAVELFGVCQDQVHVRVDVVHPALVLYFALESYSNLPVNCTLQRRQGALWLLL